MKGKFVFSLKDCSDCLNAPSECPTLTPLTGQRGKDFKESIYFKSTLSACWELVSPTS